MTTTERIKNKKTMKDLLAAIAKKPKNHLLLLFALNSGLRISDILQLQVKDVKDKNIIVIKERKTKKEKKFAVNNILQTTLEKYVEDMEPDDYLFYAQGKAKNKPMSRFAVHQLLQRLAKKIGYTGQLSAHSLRKTYARFLYEQTGDGALLQQLLNHSSQSITLKYIGVTEDEILDITRRFELY